MNTDEHGYEFEPGTRSVMTARAFRSLWAGKARLKERIRVYPCSSVVKEVEGQML